jgi:hypothetical protein
VLCLVCVTEDVTSQWIAPKAFVMHAVDAVQAPATKALGDGNVGRFSQSESFLYTLLRPCGTVTQFQIQTMSIYHLEERGYLIQPVLYCERIACQGVKR